MQSHDVKSKILLLYTFWTNSENPCQMWKSANTILHRQTLKVLPKHSSLDTLCSSLCRQTLCKTDLNNCRPISNISFLSRLLEKVVANRLHKHIYSNHLSNDLQSAYKRFHSTKTALLKIHNDIVDNMDNGKVTALTLLDLSAAFLFWVESSKISLIQIKHTLLLLLALNNNK